MGNPEPTESTTLDPLGSVYQAIGEFVLVFQWVEHLYRQIGWFILDPNRERWPPRKFHSETNHRLIDMVTDLYVDLMDQYAFPAGAERARDMSELRAVFHGLRRYRNDLLHSTYVELKAGGETHAYLLSKSGAKTSPANAQSAFQ